MADHNYGPWNITAKQIARVDSGKRGFRDPCLVCGDLWQFCPHGFEEVKSLIFAVRRLTNSERFTIINGRKEEPTVTSRTEKADELVQQAIELRRKAVELVQTAKEIRSEEATRYQYPAKPDWEYARIKVKFRTSEWNTYTYAIYMPRGGRGIFTTGQNDRTTKFNTWRDFIDWLRSDDVVWNSELTKLDVNQTVELKLP